MSNTPQIENEMPKAYEPGAVVVRTFGYSVLACFIAYLIVAIAFYVFSLTQNWPNRMDEYPDLFVITLLTAGLSWFSWWGKYWHLAVLVPLLSSSLVLLFLMVMFKGNLRIRYFFSGLSIAVYYLAIFIFFIIQMYIAGWRDGIAYPILAVWILGSFIIGYLSAWIAGKIVKLPLAASV